MPEINRRQALVIEGACLIDNENGTAPGQWLETDGRLVVLLPGPPRELELLEGCGHVMDEEGDRVFQKVRDWLVRELSAPAA